MLLFCLKLSATETRLQACADQTDGTKYVGHTITRSALHERKLEVPHGASQVAASALSIAAAPLFLVTKPTLGEVWTRMMNLMTLSWTTASGS